MSLATSAASGSRPTVAASAGELIDDRIQEAQSALWWAEFSRAGLGMLIVWLVTVLGWVVVDQWVYSPGVVVRSVVAIGLLGWSVSWLLRRVTPLLGRSIRKEYAARSLERDMPEMRQALTSYVTLHDARDSSGLRSRVVRSIGAQAAGRLRAHDALPAEATGTLKWWIAAAAALALLAAYCVISPKNTFQSATRLLAPMASIEPARRVSIQDVQPGDAEAIAGRPVEVSASIHGLKDHDEIWCRWETRAGDQASELALDQETGRFRCEIHLEHSAAGDVAYQIEAGDAKAGPFHLRVQDVPVIAVESIRYQPPSYTGQVPYTSSSASITCIDGTHVTILASTNRNVAKANIEFNPRPLGDSIRATAGAAEMQIAEDGTTLSVSFPLRSAHGRSAAVQLENYRVKVWDASGQSNPDPIIYPIRVIADLPPEVSIVMPRKSPKDVPIDAQQVIEVHAMDADFGLRRVGLNIRRGIDLVAEPTLWSDPKGAKGNRVSDYRFRPAEHGLRVGDVVQITAMATDNRWVPGDPSIEPNVSVTDPIKLRITASELVPNDPAAADGLSPPDQRPSSDAAAGEEGKQESGGGSPSAGEGGAGESETGDSGTSGAGSSGEGKTGEGATGESGTSGAGSSGEGNTGEGATGESGTTGEGKPGADPESSPQDQPSQAGQPNGEPPAKDGAADTGETPPDGGSAESGATRSNDGGSASQPSQGAPGAADPNGQPGPDGSASGESTGNEAGSSSTGESKPGETEPGKSGSESAAEGGSKSASDASTGDPTESQQTPKHDGEAFERIREYLENMKRDGGSSGQKSPKGGSKQSGESGDSGETSTDGADSRKSAAGGSAEGGSKPAGQTGSEDKSKSETGEASDPDSGHEGTGDPPSTESGSSESKTGESGAGESGTSESKAGESGTGESKSGESGTGETGSAESKTGEPQTGESGTGESGTGEKGSGERGTDPPKATSGQPGKGDSSKSGDSQQPADASQSQTQPSESASAPSQGGSGSGAGTDAGGEAVDTATPPDPVDLEYAKKATDMVLDYLEQTRDAPDRELLDRLNWTEEDLQRFAERWKQVRELDQTEAPDPKGNRDVEEALRSLGLRPPTRATANNQGTADSLRGVRDAGNRKPPPAAYQDAFDAFRRAMRRQP